MTDEQKMMALHAISPDVSLRIQCVGEWYVSLPGVERSNGHVLESGYCGGQDASFAISKKWEWATDPRYHLVLRAMKPDRREVKWNGFMWDDVNPTS